MPADPVMATRRRTTTTRMDVFMSGSLSIVAPGTRVRAQIQLYNGSFQAIAMGDPALAHVARAPSGRSLHPLFVGLHRVPAQARVIPETALRDVERLLD